MVDTQLVTGAFGYTGRYIAQELLTRGVDVRTLTRASGQGSPLLGRVDRFPLDFDDREGLCRALDGVRVLYNTYWVRFSQAGFSLKQAEQNSLKLFSAARAAGVERVIHVSITNPSTDSPFEYFRGKARLEQALQLIGLSHAILRPAVIFGPEDILINNIAWMLRRFPVFGIFGDGQYRLQPIFVEDFARLAVELSDVRENLIIDAIGPETFSYRNLVERIGHSIGRVRPTIRLPISLGLLFTWCLGRCVGDVVLTREEIGGLMAGLLATDAPPFGKTLLSEWVEANAANLGVRYANEVARRKR